MIGVIGISFKTAPVEIREKFSISNERISQFAEELQKQANFSDIVVLSTCNRTEIYFSQSVHDGFTASILVYNSLMAFKQIDFNAEEYFYTYLHDDAVLHLFKVCAGIDSMVLGEDQIIGQVKDAYVYCTELALTDAVLMRLFQKSFEAGKRVRTETDINAGATSVSFIAVDVCQKKMQNLAEKTVMLIGTGETGTLALHGLVKKGVTRFMVSNRTVLHAEHIVNTYGAQFVPFNTIEEHIASADIIIAATAAPSFVITEQMVSSQLHHIEHKQQLYIDLSVPRNIEESLQTIRNIELIAIDDLQEVIELNKEKRAACIEQGNAIIQELVTEFMEWLSFRALQPAIRAINFHLQKIYRDEYHGFVVDDEKGVKDNISEFSGFLTQKYSRALVKNLKEITDNGRKELYLQVINDLFRIGK